MQAESESRRAGGIALFVRLWFVLGLAYALVKLAVDMAFAGFIDLRWVALWELLLVPFGQAAVAYVIRRRAS